MEGELTAAPAEISTEVESTAEASPAPAEPKAAIKVDGQDDQVDIAELKKLAQLGKSSTQRFQEAAKLRQEAEAYKAKLKSDWVSAMKELGIDPREVSEKYLSEQIRQEMMTPEEKARYDLENENKSYKQRFEEMEQQKQAELREKESAAYSAQLEKEIPEALEQVGLPKSPASLRRIANHLLLATKAGYEMTVQEAAVLAKNEIKSELNHLLSLGGRYEDLIPESVAQKLMDGHLAKVKSNSQPRTNPQASSPKPEVKPNEYISETEWRKMFS